MTKSRSITVVLALILGASATLWGFSEMQSFATSPLAWGALRRFVPLVIIGLGIVSLLSSLLKINPLAAGTVLTGAIAVGTGAVWPLLVAAWFAGASYVLGGAILALLRVDPGKLSGTTTGLVGALTYGTAVGLLAHFPVNYPGVYGVLLAAPLVWRWRAVGRLISTTGQCCRSLSDFIWHDVVIVLVALVHFSVALMPEVGHDALATHLFVSAHLASRHEWGFDVNTYVWAAMPMLGDWLFSIGYMLGGETAARLINVGFIFVLGALVRELAIWAGGGALGARWAVLLFLTTPLTFTVSSSLFIESVWTSFVIAGSISIFKIIQKQDSQPQHLPVAGLLLGGALAAKAVTLTVLPVLFLVLLSRPRNWVSWSTGRALLLGLTVFLAFGMVPYITAWALTENPVFPFFNQLFRSPLWPAIAFEPPAIFGKGLTWDVLYRVTFQTEKYLESKPGAAGFQWLLLCLPTLLIMLHYRLYRGLILFVVAGLTVALTFHSTAYLRYVFPSFAWIATGIGVALSVPRGGSISALRIFHIIGWMTIALNFIFIKSGTYYGGFSIEPLLSEPGRSAYLQKTLPIRNAVGLINQLNAGSAPVAVFSTPLTAGLHVDALYPNWYNYGFQSEIGRLSASGEVGNVLQKRNVDYVILDQNWGSVDQRLMIEEATDEVKKFDSINVRKLKPKYQFQLEMLQNSDFQSPVGWTFPSRPVGYQAGRITATVSSPAWQMVPVVDGRRYQNSVTARCGDRPGQGRVQVNWLDKKAEIISADIKTFDCTANEATHVMEIAAPRGAVNAVVYASGHTDVPIIFTRVSFRR